MNRINVCLLATLLVTSTAQLGCERKAPSTSGDTNATPTSDSVDPRSKVIGVTPQPPKPEGPATTSAARSTVTKQEQSNSMPLPGQANDHSNSAKDSSQKSKEVPKK